MHLWICFHGSTPLSDGMHILSCSFHCSHLVWSRVSYYLHVPPDVSNTVIICPLVFFKNNVRHTTPWNFSKILRAPLHYWEFLLIFLCPKFSEEAPKLSENLMTIFPWSELNVTSDILGGLWYSRRVAVSIQLLLTGGVLVGSLSLLGCLSKRGSKLLWGTVFPLREIYQEVFSPHSVIVVPWQ